MLVLLQEVGNRYAKFSLATMFPRREFTSEDLNKTLLDLELTPSASVVLLPVSKSVSACCRKQDFSVVAVIHCLCLSVQDLRTSLAAKDFTKNFTI